MGEFDLNVDLWLDDLIVDPYEGETREPLSPSDSNNETYMLGFITANIVGLQYYSGTINGRELVGLLREPLNPYDGNAIKVLNTRMNPLGHIERSVAAVLSPLMDAHLIHVECIVPAKPKKGVRFKIQAQIHIFARFELFPMVISSIRDFGLNLVLNSEASVMLSEAEILKEKKHRETRSVDEIFKLVDQNVNQKGTCSYELLEPPKDIIKTNLFLHQKEGLGWLSHRENSSLLPPFWEEKDGVYVNGLTNYETTTKPEPLRGGVLADEMGLGKTLTLLSLIALDKSVFSSETDSGSVKSKKRKKSCAKPGTTLVVCPSSVVSTWITEIAEHTRGGSMKVYLYYGERTKDEDELLEHDMVLTTYSTLGSEFYSETAPAKKVEWYRIILDEAHVIKNSYARQSQAVTSLKGDRRWVVTGTPIQNGTYDLFSLMAFLRFQPFSEKTWWETLIQRPLSNGNHTGLSRLQVLMETISLRRTKEKALNLLPARTVETYFVDLSEEEKRRYDQVEEEAKTFLQECISSQNVTRNYTRVLSVILRLRQICTHIDLCPADLNLQLASHGILDIAKNPDLLKKLISALQEGEDLDCPICISPPAAMVITRCAHIFCQSCIVKSLKRSKPSCPMCRSPLSESDLFSAPPESVESEDIASSSSSSNPSRSSKICLLLKLLTELRNQDPGVKSVVFSQFRKMLTLLEQPLTEAGFKILRLDGTMTAKKRADVIKNFQMSDPDGATVLLSTLKASSAGVNLTVASRIFLLEPWWNPVVEEQAMDRVHRIGQTKEVKILRFIARNSIEERILQLQEKKKLLAREAFGGRLTKNRREVGIHDLRLLMAL